MISWQNMMEIAWLWDCAPAQIRRNGLSVSRQQVIWQPDRFGMACFRNKVKETLVGFSLDDLKELDIHEIIYHVNKQISQSDHKAQKETVTQWQTELREAYQLGLEHKDHWQDRVREAIKALKQWYEGYFIKGKDVSKAPLPYMDINYRKPDSEDLPWMYWILGMKLEDVFGIERVFVPEDVKKEMDDLDLYRHIEKPVWSIICFATIEDFKTWWEFIHANLNEQTTTETVIIKVNNERKIEQIDDFCNWTDKLIEYIKHPDKNREISKTKVDTLGDQVNNLAQKIWSRINIDESGWPYQSTDISEYANLHSGSIFSVQPELKERIIERLQQWKGRALEDKSRIQKKLKIQRKQETQQVGSQERGGQASDTKQATLETTRVKAEPICDQVFICYSHKDKRWLDDLQTHLKPYLRNVSLTSWSDRQIAPGSKWFSKIKTALAHTKVAVLLVTPNFLASDFIHEHELTPLLKEVDKGEVRIIWIPVRACSYKQTPLKDYQAAIDPDKPLANMKAERDEAWVRICDKVNRAATS